MQIAIPFKKTRSLALNVGDFCEEMRWVLFELFGGISVVSFFFFFPQEERVRGVEKRYGIFLNLYFCSVMWVFFWVAKSDKS